MLILIGWNWPAYYYNDLVLDGHLPLACPPLSRGVNPSCASRHLQGRGYNSMTL